MKRVALNLSLLFVCCALVFVSCKEQATTTNDAPATENAIEKADMAMTERYKCPMDCEDGKMYDAEGNCPKCDMKLEKVAENSSDEDTDTAEMTSDSDTSS